MTLITWGDRFSVGIPSMDARHVVLVETLNELNSAMMKGDARNLAGSILRSVLAYSRNLFSAEETILAAAHYPDLARHQMLHRDLTLKVEGLIGRCERGESALNLNALHFLFDSLISHLQKVDPAYGPCLAQHGVR
jgi:hemerythrin